MVHSAVSAKDWRDIIHDLDGTQRLALAVLAQMSLDSQEIFDDEEFLTWPALVANLAHWRGFWFAVAGFFQLALEPPEEQARYVLKFREALEVLRES